MPAVEAEMKNRVITTLMQKATADAKAMRSGMANGGGGKYGPQIPRTASVQDRRARAAKRELAQTRRVV
jgi:hypothetical protein